jgi:hypothetical protein
MRTQEVRNKHVITTRVRRAVAHHVCGIFLRFARARYIHHVEAFCKRPQSAIYKIIFDSRIVPFSAAMGELYLYRSPTFSN